MDEARRIIQSVDGINPQAVEDSMDVLQKYRTNRLIARGIKSLVSVYLYHFLSSPNLFCHFNYFKVQNDDENGC